MRTVLLLALAAIAATPQQLPPTHLRAPQSAAHKAVRCRVVTTPPQRWKVGFTACQTEMWKWGHAPLELKAPSDFGKSVGEMEFDGPESESARLFEWFKYAMHSQKI